MRLGLVVSANEPMGEQGITTGFDHDQKLPLPRDSIESISTNMWQRIKRAG